MKRDSPLTNKRDQRSVIATLQRLHSPLLRWAFFTQKRGELKKQPWRCIALRPAHNNAAINKIRRNSLIIVGVSFTGCPQILM
jgi:hypothetical protein